MTINEQPTQLAAIDKACAEYEAACADVDEMILSLDADLEAVYAPDSPLSLPRPSGLSWACGRCSSLYSADGAQPCVHVYQRLDCSS